VPGDVTGGGDDTFLLHLDVETCGARAPANQAPEVSLQAPASGTEGQTLTVTGTGTDPDGDPLSWTWSGGASGTDSVAEVVLGDGPGQVTVTATVDDGSHTVTRSRTIEVLNAPPVVSLDAAALGVAGAPGAFSASVSDPGGDEVSCSVTFGDGTPAADTCTGSHTWVTPGSHEVTVTATDDDGATAVDTVTVVVTAPPVQPPVEVEAPDPGHLELWVRGRQRQHLGTRDARQKVRLFAGVRSDVAVPLRVRGKVQLRVHGKPVTLRLQPKRVSLVADHRRRLHFSLRRPAALMVTEALQHWREATQAGRKAPGVRATLVFRVTWADGTTTREVRKVQLR
jgi:hypothetical protein